MTLWLQILDTDHQLALLYIVHKAYHIWGSSRLYLVNIITHILSVSTEHSVNGISFMCIPVEDVDLVDLSIDLPSAVEFIEDALCDEGVVLWKGYLEARLSSQLTALTYLIVVMHTQRVNATQALQMVRLEQIWPIPDFQEQLVLYELYQYAQSTSNGIYVNRRDKLNNRWTGLKD
ncbi:phosphatases II [Lentinula edodes]|nr:phosphatases II [Lentinula edodes]